MKIIINKIDDIKKHLKSLISEGKYIEVGERVVDKDGNEGTLDHIIHEQYQIKRMFFWDHEEEVSKHTTNIRPRSGWDCAYGFLKMEVKEEFDYFLKMLKHNQGVTNRIDLLGFIHDYNYEMPNKELKEKYNITDLECDYLMDCPEIRYAFS